MYTAIMVGIILVCMACMGFGIMIGYYICEAKHLNNVKKQYNHMMPEEDGNLFQ